MSKTSPEKNREAVRRWRINNPEKYAETKKAKKEKHIWKRRKPDGTSRISRYREKLKNDKERSERLFAAETLRQKQNRDNLSNSYVSRLLKKMGCEPTNETIAIKRSVIEIRRIIKQHHETTRTTTSNPC